MATPKTTEQDNTTTAKAQSNNEQTTAESIEQLQAATTQLYEALHALGGAQAGQAKIKLQEGKKQAQLLGSEAEECLRERPLVTAGVAFVAGYLVSRWLQR